MKVSEKLIPPVFKKGVEDTPGKADDALQAAQCLSLKLADIFAEAQEKFVDEDGTFLDIKLGEVSKWMPILNFAAEKLVATGQECFGEDIRFEVKNPLLRLVLLQLVPALVKF